MLPKFTSRTDLLQLTSTQNFNRWYVLDLEILQMNRKPLQTLDFQHPCTNFFITFNQKLQTSRNLKCSLPTYKGTFLKNLSKKLTPKPKIWQNPWPTKKVVYSQPYENICACSNPNISFIKAPNHSILPRSMEALKRAFQPYLPISRSPLKTPRIFKRVTVGLKITPQL